MSVPQDTPAAAPPTEIARLLEEHRASHGLPRPFYHDAAVFAHDIARIFQRVLRARAARADGGQ